MCCRPAFSMICLVMCCKTVSMTFLGQVMFATLRNRTLTTAAGLEAVTVADQTLAAEVALSTSIVSAVQAAVEDLLAEAAVQAAAVEEEEAKTRLRRPHHPYHQHLHAADQHQLHSLLSLLPLSGQAFLDLSRFSDS